MRLLWWLKYKHPVPSIVRTCRIVHGLPVYIVGYGPRVNGNLPGISSWICSVSALVYKGFMSMPCIKKTVVVKSIISEKYRKNVLSRLLSYKSFKMGWSESMKFCCWLSPVLGIKQFTCADKNIQFMRAVLTSGVCQVNFSAGSAPFSCFLASCSHSGWSVCLWLLRHEQTPKVYLPYYKK